MVEESRQGKLIKRDPEAVPLTKRVLGLGATIPNGVHVSSPRLAMGLNVTHSQGVPLNNPDKGLILTGMEKMMGDATHAYKASNDLQILQVVNKKHGNIIMKTLIVYIDVDGNVGAEIIVPYTSTDGKYGLLHRYNKDLRPGKFFNKGDNFTTIPNVINDQYTQSVTLNVAFISPLNSNEDGIVISKRAQEKLEFSYIKKYIIEVNAKDILAQINNGSPLPDVGSKVREDGILCSKITTDPSFDLYEKMTKTLTEHNDLQDLTSLGMLNVLSKNGGEVIDIFVISQTKNSTKPVGYHTIHDQLEYYAELEIEFLQSIIRLHDKYIREGNVSKHFTKITLDALGIVNGPKDNRTLYAKKSKLPHFYIEVTVAFPTIPDIGGKVTSQFGSKGIVSNIVENSENIPEGVDIVIPVESVISRQNIGIMYHAYFSKFISLCNDRVKEYIWKNGGFSEESIAGGFDIIYRHIELLGEANAITMLDSIKSNYEAKKILVETANKGDFRTILSFDFNDISAEKVIRIAESEYAVPRERVTIDGKLSKYIIGVYKLDFFLLGKSPDEMMNSTAPFFRPNGKPSSGTKNNSNSGNFSAAAPKFLSEQEVLLLLAWTNAERKDLRLFISALSSPKYYMVMYHNMIKNYNNVTENLIDENDVPVHDSAIERTKFILSMYGIELTQEEEGNNGSIS